MGFSLISGRWQASTVQCIIILYAAFGPKGCGIRKATNADPTWPVQWSPRIINKSVVLARRAGTADELVFEDQICEYVLLHASANTIYYYRKFVISEMSIFEGLFKYISKIRGSP